VSLGHLVCTAFRTACLEFSLAKNPPLTGFLLGKKIPLGKKSSYRELLLYILTFPRPLPLLFVSLFFFSGFLGPGHQTLVGMVFRENSIKNFIDIKGV
jgi:hypothetical protein